MTKQTNIREEIGKIIKFIPIWDEGLKEYQYIWTYLTVDNINEAIDKLESIFTQQKTELVEKIEKKKVGSCEEWIEATREYGGTKGEWHMLQTSKTYDEVLDDVLEIIKEQE